MNFFNNKVFCQQIFDYLQEVEEKVFPLLRFIKKGTFIRSVENEVYRSRLAYTKELRRIVYNPVLFNEILLNPELKEKFFRSFGYRGNLDFTIYPNSWLRDLALVDYSIGKNVYLADGIVLGTNQVSPCQRKLNVGPIIIGDDTLFDQNCKVGLKTTIGERCTIGISCHIGLLCKIGNGVKLGPLSNVGHFTKIGDNVSIGLQSSIGIRCIVEANATILDFSTIPSYSLVQSNGKIIERYTA